MSPLVFVHGSGHGAWAWQNFTRFMAEQGRDCWAVSLRGQASHSSFSWVRPLRSACAGPIRPHLACFCCAETWSSGGVHPGEEHPAV